MPKDDEICAKCGQDFTINKAGGLECSICSQWLHKACTGLPNESFKAMVKMKEELGYHGWACASCGKATQELKNMLVAMASRVSKIETDVGSNTKKISELDDKVSDLDNKVIDIDKNIDSIDNDLTEVAKDVDKLKSMNPVEQANIDFQNELHERAIRRDNLLIHNAPEPGPELTTIRAKKQFDMKILDDICKELDIDFRWEDDVKFISRVGPLLENGSSRPIICGLRDRSLRDRLLNLQYKLSKSRNLPKYRMVADLTKNERDREYAMESECKKRNDEIKLNDPNATFLWMLVGPKGAKRMVQKEENPRKRGRGEGGRMGRAVQSRGRLIVRE